ncbi:chromate transport protein ChrA [Vibrio ponticus]|nr:chromate transport protein ChrA [Vibrio ponticus]
MFNPLDVALVLVGFYLMKQLKLPIIWMVVTFILAGLAMGMLG